MINVAHSGVQHRGSSVSVYCGAGRPSASPWQEWHCASVKCWFSGRGWSGRTIRVSTKGVSMIRAISGNSLRNYCIKCLKIGGILAFSWIPLLWIPLLVLLEMSTATFQFSESGGSLNGRNFFTELPFLQKSLPNPLIHCMPPPFSLKKPFFSLKRASSDPLPKNRLLLVLCREEKRQTTILDKKYCRDTSAGNWILQFSCHQKNIWNFLREGGSVLQIADRKFSIRRFSSQGFPAIPLCQWMFDWGKKKPNKHKGFWRDTPLVCVPSCPGDTSHLSRDMSRLSLGHSGPLVLIYT